MTTIYECHANASGAWGVDRYDNANEENETKTTLRPYIGTQYGRYQQMQLLLGRDVQSDEEALKKALAWAADYTTVDG